MGKRLAPHTLMRRMISNAWTTPDSSSLDRKKNESDRMLKFLEEQHAVGLLAKCKLTKIEFISFLLGDKTLDRWQLKAIQGFIADKKLRNKQKV